MVKGQAGDANSHESTAVPAMVENPMMCGCTMMLDTAGAQLAVADQFILQGSYRHCPNTEVKSA